MMSSRGIRIATALLAAILGASRSIWVPVEARPLVPGADGSGTRVNREGDRYDIRGGQLSGGGDNLFHTFRQFNLSEGETANFISSPSIRNILTRVVAGDASIINGTLQITGSNANLFLLNPAGIFFGEAARLQLPGSFVATTARGIGFDGGLFDAWDANNYQALVGEPNHFIFDMQAPGGIVNAGTLALSPGKNLTLMGGTVINTGTLSAPGGNIAVTAVPGKNMVLVSQEGMVLNLEIEPIGGIGAGIDRIVAGIKPLDLPQLLTEGSAATGHAIAATVNPDGTIALTGSSIAIPAIPAEPGTAIVGGQVETTGGSSSGAIDILAEQIAVTGANIDASGSFGGGTIRIGGDFRGRGRVPNAQRAFVSSDSVISADALLNGNGGNIVVWADKITHFSGTITARGSLASGSLASGGLETGQPTVASAPGTISNGGFVEISGKENLIFQGTVNLSASNGHLGTLLLDPKDIQIKDGSGMGTEDGTLPDVLAEESGSSPFVLYEETLESLAGNANIILEATNNIKIEDLSDNTLEFSAGNGTIAFVADADNSGQGSFAMEPGDEIRAAGRSINISGARIEVGSIDTSAQNNGGNIELTSSGGNITVGNLNTISTNGMGGNIDLDAGSGLVNITRTARTRNLTVIGDALDFAEADSIRGTGKLVLQPGTASQDIELGGSRVTPALDLSANEIEAIADGFESIAIGRPDGTGKVVLNNGASFNAPVIIAGGSTLVGPNRNAIWKIAGMGRGSIEGYPNGLTFENIENLTGGDRNDTFIFRDGGAIAGIIDGGKGRDALDYSAYQTEVLVDIANSTATGTGGVFNIESVIPANLGSSGGSNSNNSGNNSGNSGGSNSNNSGNNSGNSGASNSNNSGNNSGNSGASNSNNSGNNSGNSGASNSNNSGNNSGNSGASNSNNSENNSGNSGASNSNNSENNSGNSGASNSNNSENNSGNSGASNSNNSGNNSGSGGTSQPVSSVTPVTISPPTPITPGAALPDASDAPEVTESGNSANSEPASPEPASPEPASPEPASPEPISLPTPENPGLPFDFAQDMPSFASSANNSAILSASGADSVPASPPENSPPAPIIPAIAPNNLAANNPVSNNPVPVTAIVPNNPAPNNPAPNNPAPNNPAPARTPIPALIPEPARAPAANLAPNNPAPNNPAPNNPAPNNPAPVTAIAPNNPAPVTAIAPNNPAPVTAIAPNNPAPVTAIAPNNPAPNNPAPNNPDLNPAISPNLAAITESNNRETSPGSPVDFLYRSTEDRSISSGMGGSDRLPPDTGNQQILRVNTREDIERFLDEENLARAVQEIDFFFSEDFENYLRQKYNKPYLTFVQIQDKLGEMADAKTAKTAIIYIFTRPEQLDLVLVTPEGESIHKSIPTAHRAALLEQVQAFKRQIADPTRRRTASYLPASQKLYQWFVAPLESELEELGIDTLIFSMDKGLRTLPLAALHDGQEFLVQKYSISITPSLHLTDVRYADIKNASVLAMGISEFEDQNPLPAVPVEIATITESWQSGQAFLNEGFTLDNLKLQREKQPFEIIHLATHGQFQSGQEENSYLQLWDGKLHLERMGELEWDEPAVELLVLSACRTAVGDAEAEYGFAGLAVQAGVKSALASLWYANDTGTLSLMSEFYHKLRSAPIKASALRKAQIAMIEESVRLENGELIGTFGTIPLPAELAEMGDRALSHPYYWAGFTMIGSPW